MEPEPGAKTTFWTSTVEPGPKGNFASGRPLLLLEQAWIRAGGGGLSRIFHEGLGTKHGNNLVGPGTGRRNARNPEFFFKPAAATSSRI